MVIIEDQYSGLLVKGAAEMGIHLDQENISKFTQFTDMLVDWNSKMNLTSIATIEDIVKLHYLDSLSCLASANKYMKNCRRIIDVGTGAGFPGIPLLIMDPTLTITFLDSLKKRLKFIDYAIEAMGLPKMIYLHGRAEDEARDAQHREVYDCALSRAVARLNVLVEYCVPYLVVDGVFIAMKGPNVTHELDDGARAAKLLGAEMVDIINFNLPFNTGERNLVVFKKIRMTGAAYPRKAGVPAKEPL